MPPKKKLKADKDQQRLSSFFVSNVSPSPSSVTHALFYTDRKLLITGFLEKVVVIEFQLKPKYLF